MRILFLSDNFAPETNAPATRLLEHARAWVRAGHRVTVVTCAPNFPTGRVFEGYTNAWRSREVVDGIDVVRVKTYVAPNRGKLRRTLDYLSFMASGALAALSLPRHDVVVATSPQFFAAIAGWIVAALQHRPFVFELRDLWPASIAAVGAVRRGFALRCVERLELFLYARADAIVAVSDAFRRDLVARGVDVRKLHVVTNGVDLSAYAPRAKERELEARFGLQGKFVIGYLGTHGMAHALENVLEAASLLAHRRDVHFLFAGDGAAKEALVVEARRRELRNVSFEDAVAKDAMPALWSVCDVALIHLKNTPVFETVIPSKLFEALGMGLPVLLAAPAGEVSAIVRELGCGVHVAPEDPHALAAAVVEFVRDAELRERCARAAHASAPRYERGALALRMLDVLESVARRAEVVEPSASISSATRGAPTKPAEARESEALEIDLDRVPAALPARQASDVSASSRTEAARR